MPRSPLTALRRNDSYQRGAIAAARLPTSEARLSRRAFFVTAQRVTSEPAVLKVRGRPKRV